MVHIKTKEGASLWIALLATAIVAVGMVIQHIEWWITLCTSVGVFVVVALAALFIIRKYVAYKLKPIIRSCFRATCTPTRSSRN